MDAEVNLSTPVWMSPLGGTVIFTGDIIYTKSKYLVMYEILSLNKLSRGNRRRTVTSHSRGKFPQIVRIEIPTYNYVVLGGRYIEVRLTLWIDGN